MTWEKSILPERKRCVIFGENVSTGTTAHIYKVKKCITFQKIKETELIRKWSQFGRFLEEKLHFQYLKLAMVNGNSPKKPGVQQW